MRSVEEAREAVYERAGRLQRRRRVGRAVSTTVALVLVVGLVAGLGQRRSTPAATVDAGSAATTAPAPPSAGDAPATTGPTPTAPAPPGSGVTSPGASDPRTSATSGGGTGTSTTMDPNLPLCTPEDLKVTASWLSDQVQPVDGVFDAQPAIDSATDHDCRMKFSPLTVSVQNEAGFEYFHYAEPRVLVSLRAAARSQFFYGNVWWDSSCRDTRTEVSVCTRPTPGSYTMTIDFFGFRRSLPLTVTSGP